MVNASALRTGLAAAWLAVCPAAGVQDGAWFEQFLTESLDMTAVGERIVTSVRELFGVKASMLRLLEPDGSLRALAWSGEAFSQRSGGDVLPPGTGLAGVPAG